MSIDSEERSWLILVSGGYGDMDMAEKIDVHLKVPHKPRLVSRVRGQTIRKLHFLKRV